MQALPIISRGLPLCFAAALMATAHAPAHAQTISASSDVGHNAGAQCVTTAINDAGVMTGNCVQANNAGPLQAYYTQNNAEVALLPDATGDACKAVAPNNTLGLLGSLLGYQIAGVCRDSDGNRHTVTWNTANSTTAASQLGAYTGPSATMPDIETFPTAADANGDIVGMSVAEADSSTGPVRTAVLWSAGSKTATMVSLTYGDGCVPVDVAAGELLNGPSVLIDCPATYDASGNQLTAKSVYIAQPTSLLGIVQTGAYTATQLPVTDFTTGVAYDHCVGSAINSLNQATGTCYDVNDQAYAVYWPGPGSNPHAAPVPKNSAVSPLASSGVYLNDNGEMAFSYVDADQKAQTALWNASGNAASATQVPPVSGGTQTWAKGLGNNNVVLINSDIQTQGLTAASYNASTGITTALGDLSGAYISAAVASSPSGSMIAAEAEDANQNDEAVELTSP